MNDTNDTNDTNNDNGPGRATMILLAAAVALVVIGCGVFLGVGIHDRLAGDVEGSWTHPLAGQTVVRRIDDGRLVECLETGRGISCDWANARAGAE
ncbi:hypothetical protein [Bifidobacterium myosotis]|uniref:Uncharacterized protein n=1 Tax=Bifidobacterium myosotis TaxID=1630166 RepID=A0A5M9ZKW3_9BIFI|nr:hypothetical protein [Bifidobacterium myosotis]KAA8828155.1 hypothetical protein EMO91_06860 [Bifidobacterium myosotis]